MGGQRSAVLGPERLPGWVQRGLLLLDLKRDLSVLVPTCRGERCSKRSEHQGVPVTDESDVVAPLQAADRRAAMLARRDEMHALHPEVTTAGEFCLLMGDLAVEYWIWQLEQLKASGFSLGSDPLDATSVAPSEASPKEETG